MSRSSVLLPLPDAPTMAVREPCGTSSEMSSSTGVEPNAFETPETVSFIGFDLPGLREHEDDRGDRQQDEQQRVRGAPA